MGVHSLWEIVNPSARPVRLEALSRKKLAVDASIWIYQFLKAVRDKEGHSLKNSHIVGFFRRICKLLYFGIQPVFVFDGGAPVLKRNTIRKRKERRKDKQESLQTTAAKFLAIQLQKRANERYEEETSPKKKQQQQLNAKSALTKKEQDNLEYATYYEDVDYMNVKNDTSASAGADAQLVPKKTEKVFRKDDDYHLPDDHDLNPTGDDQRMITDYEFQRLTEGLESDIEGIDLDNVDPSSEAFKELSLATQYMVLSHLRLRSRLRMGYTKEQLVTLFPKSMDFSKFQIAMVQKRNFLTQKLLHVAGMDSADIVTTRRIAGEKGREYQLVKNEDGYSLTLSKEDHSSAKPVYLDETGNVIEMANDDAGEEDDEGFEFEDVPIRKEPGVQQREQETLDELFQQTENKMMDMYKQSNEYDSGADNQYERMIKYHKSGVPDDQQRNKQTASNLDLKMPSKTYAFTATTNDSADNSTAAHDSIPIPDFEGTQFSFKNSSLFQEEPSKAESITIIDQPAADIKRTADPVRHTSAAAQSKKVVEERVDDVKVDANNKEPVLAPSWFGKSQVGFGKSNPYNTDYSIYNKDLRATQDEQLGLLSAEQARDFLQNEEAEEFEASSEDESEEVEIIDQQSVHNSPTDVDEKQPTAEAESKQISDIIASKNDAVAVMDYDFSESEEEDLIDQLQQEELEHERFKSSLNNGPDNSWSLQNEQELQNQRRKDRRDADEVTQGMVQDVQELLSRFGIPFITAPMEAEAQCAELLRLKLVDGIITDDSDCFLFGGDVIYKNMFNEKNYVECYLMEDIQRDFGLTRDNFIELAQLLGSDYTEGVKGVGKVTAMEILAEFQSDEDKSALINFRNWWIEYQKGARIDPKESSIRKKLRKSFQQKLFLDVTFPDPMVTKAYLEPEVDHDPTAFIWGSPDLDKLRTFLMYTIGWSQAKVDEVLVPVIRDINKKQQTTISEFFPRDAFQTRKNLMVGKRLKEATSRLTNKRQKK